MSVDMHDDYEVEVHEEIVQDDGPSPVDRHERVEIIRNRGLVQRQQIVEDRGAARYAALFELTNLVWLLTSMLEFLLLVRLALKLIGANAVAPFVALVYGLSDLFLWPFFGMIWNPGATNGIVLEITTLIAMFVYAGLGAILVKLIQMFTAARPRSGRQVRIERHERL